MRKTIVVALRDYKAAVKTKAFLIGLVLIRLQEYHEGRRHDSGAGLRHVTLIEEAHRLLRNVSTEQGSEVTANPKGRAIEVFANILSEIRAYGEGIVIAEQVPVTINRSVARVIPRQVAVQQCTLVPIAVPTCLSCN